MGKNRTLKLVEKVNTREFHHENRLLLDEVDGALIEIRKILDAERADNDGTETVECEEGTRRRQEWHDDG